jgi:hypothetical protein
MPCKTVVFVEDLIYLDSLAFCQMSGRVGCCGHDVLGTWHLSSPFSLMWLSADTAVCKGHVLFFGLPYSKVQRLLTADHTCIRYWWWGVVIVVMVVVVVVVVVVGSLVPANTSRGEFPVNVSLVLHCMILHHQVPSPSTILPPTGWT